MPHLSKNKVSNSIKKKLDEHLFYVLEAGSSLTKKGVFFEVFSFTERMMVAKRIMVIYMINEGYSTHEISRILKMSPSTVARYEVGYEGGKYKNILVLLKNKRIHTRLKAIFKPFLIPLIVYGKSFNSVIKSELEGS